MVSTSRSSWKETVHTVTVDFAQNGDDLELRRRSDFGKLQLRQVASSSTATPSAAATTTVPTTVSFPYVPSSSAMPTETSITKNINWQIQPNQQILPLNTSVSIHGSDVYVLLFYPSLHG